jgi:catechol 2,3-dioxygenase-like lactoylglutathione lyase family enzyme
MKRFHVHVAVPDLERSIRFYSTVFGAEPSVVKPDYAKWMLEDPRVNFAISQRGGEPGVNHLGFQVDDADELTSLHARLQAADSGAVEEKSVSCCYANSDKYWVTDPAGVAWETFRSLGTVPFYNGAATPEAVHACCAPTQAANEQSACRAPAPATGTGRSCCS